MANRVWLDVPYSEKDDAKALGARWDPTAKRWYSHGAPGRRLARWMPLAELLPGEDRSFGSGLFVDLIPASCWFTNLRSCVSPADWDRIRRMVSRRAGQRCEICAAPRDPTTGRRLEAHERWLYDHITHIQTLKRLICLCTDCHRTTHYGHAEVNGEALDAHLHLRAVTGMTEAQAIRHVSTAFELWERRSTHTWTLDVRMITAAGITPSPPPAPTERDATARITSQAAQMHRADAEYHAPPAPPPPAASSPCDHDGTPGLTITENYGPLPPQLAQAAQAARDAAVPDHAPTQIGETNSRAQQGAEAVADATQTNPGPFTANELAELGKLACRTTPPRRR